MDRSVSIIEPPPDRLSLSQAALAELHRALFWAIAKNTVLVYERLPGACAQRCGNAVQLVAFPGSSTEPAMNGTSGIQEVRSTTFQSPSNRLLRKQLKRFGTALWQLLHTHGFIVPSTKIKLGLDKTGDTICMLPDSKTLELD